MPGAINFSHSARTQPRKDLSRPQARVLGKAIMSIDCMAATGCTFRTYDAQLVERSPERGHSRTFVWNADETLVAPAHATSAHRAISDNDRRHAPGLPCAYNQGAFLCGLRLTEPIGKTLLE
jgi:hypothetical protein